MDGNTIVALIVFLATYVAISLERIHRTIVAISDTLLLMISVVINLH